MSDRRMEIWGLTGGIASGKTLAGAFFEEAGIPVLDADKLARELSSPGGAAHQAILNRFGTADRATLRTQVFQDPNARRDLEAILHPLIREESSRRIAAQITAMGAKRMIYEAALLVETGRYRDFSGLIVIEAPLEERKRRLILRDGLSEEMVDRIISSQASDEERRQAAQVVIHNDGTPEDLRKRVLAFIEKQGW